MPLRIGYSISRVSGGPHVANRPPSMPARNRRSWAQSGVFLRIFDVIEEDLDLKAVMVDGTFAKVHQHGAGAKKRLPA